MATDNRPISPHLQIYRPQLTSVLSLLNRATGIFLSIGTILLVYWIAAVADGPESYLSVQSYLGSIIGRILLFGWTFSLLFHLCNGIRHFFWDAGMGYELETTYMSGWTALIVAALLTIICWWIGYQQLGGV